VIRQAERIEEGAGHRRAQLLKINRQVGAEVDGVEVNNDAIAILAAGEPGAWMWRLREKRTYIRYCE
jgi:hypothetical protein